MFEYGSNKGLCMVYLDTVMPGCVCFDVGDFIRSACNNKNEDEKNTKCLGSNAGIEYVAIDDEAALHGYNGIGSLHGIVLQKVIGMEGDDLTIGEGDILLQTGKIES